MKRLLSMGYILLFAVCVPLFSAGKGDATAGKAVYTKRCATCHGAAGEGKEAIAKMLKVEMRHLGSKEVQAKSDAELRKVIVEGTGKMKPVTGLTDSEVANLIAYVRSLAKK
jgi:mono/diheme cytochrome c family protein